MSLSSRLGQFSQEHPLSGPLLWIASIQYFVVQLIVAWAWPVQYSWSDNVISNLGNTTACSPENINQICSPLAWLMNLSFIAIGITTIVGAYLIFNYLGRSGRTGFRLIALGGVGYALVGLFPENTVGAMHLIGAILALVVVNFGLIALAFSLKNLPNSLRLYTFLSGFVALIGFLLFVFAGSDGGAWERLAAYPTTIWTIIIGLYLLAKESN